MSRHSPVLAEKKKPLASDPATPAPSQMLQLELHLIPSCLSQEPNRGHELQSAVRGSRKLETKKKTRYYTTIP